MVKIVAVCISQTPILCEYGAAFKYYNLVERTAISTKNPYVYTKRLADKRNRAVDNALAKFPESDHIMMCDSYYATQTGSLHQLIYDYDRHGLADRAILGGAIWGRIRTRLGQ